MGNLQPLSDQQKRELFRILQTRFEVNTDRHKGIEWKKVQAKLDTCHSDKAIGIRKLFSLYEMEQTGGEPDVVGYDSKLDQFIFYDCSAESPIGRRSVCYDREAWKSRKEPKPVTSALDMATEMGVEILTETQYRKLQTLGNFDSKTSSWIKTPQEIRKLGGALFADLRFNHVFIYHNGAESYYAARGFRSSLRI